MGLLGKPIVLGSRGYYEDADFILRLYAKDEVSDLLEKSLGNFDAREIRRTAFRMAYYYAFEFEMPFPLVTMTGVVDSVLNYRDTAALMPGKDRVLDQICDFLIQKTPLFPAPTKAECDRSEADENAFFDWLEHSPDPLRDPYWMVAQKEASDFGRSLKVLWRRALAKFRRVAS